MTNYYFQTYSLAYLAKSNHIDYDEFRIMIPLASNYWTRRIIRSNDESTPRKICRISSAWTASSMSLKEHLDVYNLTDQCWLKFSEEQVEQLKNMFKKHNVDLSLSLSVKDHTIDPLPEVRQSIIKENAEQIRINEKNKAESWLPWPIKQIWYDWM